MEKMTSRKAKSILKKNNLEADGKYLFNAFNDTEVFKALLAAGADPNHLEVEFDVPILSLAYSRQEYVPFMLLIQYGANPDVPSSTNADRTPIIFEMVDPQTGIDRYLWHMIQANANLNQLHPQTGYTLLMHSASRYYVSIDTLEYLIARGANPNLPNKAGFTIYDLIDEGKINLHKPELLMLKKHQMGYQEPATIQKEFLPPAQKPDLKIQFSHSLSAWRGIEVLDKTEDILTVRMYNLGLYDSDFPRTHTHALNIVFSLLENAKTPSEWQQIAAAFEFKKYHLGVARKYIQSFEVSDFHLEYDEELWEGKRGYNFEDITDEMRGKLLHATMNIRVNDPEMLETIETDRWIKIPEFHVDPFWYLENSVTSSFFVLYSSEGGKWMSREGQIGTDGTGKPVGGIGKGYYKEENNRAEIFAMGKVEEGYALIYKNYDTTYNLEEGIIERARQEKINENKADYSEEAFEAIREKDISKLKTILETGVHPDTLKDKYGNPALEDVAGSYFAEQVHLEMLRLLLEKGANPNNEAYDHPLLQQVTIHAKNEIHDEIVRSLINAGADFSLVSKSSSYQKSSPLQCACRGGMLWFVEFLLDKGADVHYKDENGLSAINYALESERNVIEIIDVLLGSGADKNDLHVFSYGKNAFERARIPEMIEKLVSLGFDINMPNKSDLPAIYDAAMRGTLEIFATFLRLGADFELHWILSRITENFYRNDKENIERQVEKLRMMHNLGYAIISASGNNPLEALHDNFKKRKKITKWEEKVLLDLWEMDCKPRHLRDLNNFHEYVTKVNSVPLMEKCKAYLNEIQAALN